MPTKTKDDEFIDIVAAEGDGWQGSCAWRDDVCLEPVTHFIKNQPTGEAELEVDLYCARHYALELASRRQLHFPRCVATPAEHIAGFGSL